MLDIFENSAEFKLKRMLDVLEHQHKIRLNLDANPNELVSVYQECDLIKDQILEKKQFNTYHTDREYVKNCLIQESIRLFLTEIAPARRRGKARSKK
jgi:hypothetical protein